MKVRELIKSDRDTIVSVISNAGVFAAQMASDADAVIYVSSDTSISKATQVMAGNKIGFSIVIDESGKLAGVLSERDIIIALSKGFESASDVKVSEIMTKNVATCSPDENILDAIETMGSLSIRHLVVVENENVVGVLSTRDIFEMMAKRIDAHGLTSTELTLKALEEDSFSPEEPNEIEVAHSIRR